MNKKKNKKKRSVTYEKPLKIHATFDQAMKALVAEQKATPPHTK
jgi:hypothetical protein